MATHAANTPWSPALQNSYGPEATMGNYPHEGPQVVPHAGPEAVPPHAAPEPVPGQSPDHGYVQKAYEYRGDGEPLPKKTKKILGLTVALFWLIVGLVVLLVLGISLGVGLGVGLNQRATSSTSPASSAPSSAQNQQATTTSASTLSTSTSPSTTTSTQASSTSSAPVTSGTTGVADNSCTYSVPTTYYSNADSNVHLVTYCFTDWPNHDAAADGNGTVADLRYTILYSFEDCMDECVRYNKDLTPGESKCAGVTYNSNLTSIVAIGQQGGNCFLKNATGVNRQGSATSACGAIVY